MFYVDDFVIMYNRCYQKEITAYYQQVRRMDSQKRLFYFQEYDHSHAFLSW